MKKIFLFSICCCLLLVFGSLFSNAENVKIDDGETEFSSQILVIKNSGKVKILSPRSTIPVFAEVGRNFTLTIETKEYENIYIYISTAYETIVDEIQCPIEYILQAENKNEIIVLVPEETPPELYNLTVIITIDDKYYFDSKPRAVSIVDEFKDNFTFIHMADFHVGDIRGFAESIKETIGFKSIKKAIEEVNLLNPDFVLISGDLVFGQLIRGEYKWEYKKCYELIQMFDVPTFLTPGNHDGYYRIGEDGLKIWQEYFGSLYYSFNYGNYHFQSINSYDHSALHRFCLMFIPLNWGGCISNNQLDWIQDDLKQNPANLTFQFMHHSPLRETTSNSLMKKAYTNRLNLINLIDTNGVDMVLAGHTHHDNVSIVNNTIYITTTTPESEMRHDDGYWGYRMIEIVNGSIYKYNYKEPHYSIPSYKIKIERLSEKSTKITNNLDDGIKVFVKYTVPKANYTIINGNVEMIRENIYQKQYYLSCDIPSKQNKTILLCTFP